MFDANLSWPAQEINSVQARETPSSISSWFGCDVESPEIQSYPQHSSDTGRHFRYESNVNSAASLSHGVRALRVIKLINDYCTLLINIVEQIISILLNILEHVGYIILIQSHAVLRGLLANTYKLTAVAGDTKGSRNEAAKIIYLREYGYFSLTIRRLLRASTELYLMRALVGTKRRKSTLMWPQLSAGSYFAKTPRTVQKNIVSLCDWERSMLCCVEYVLARQRIAENGWYWRR